MIRRFLGNKAGQTAIEYLLLIVVSIGLGVAFYKKMKEYLLDSPNSIISKQLNSFTNKINQDPTGRYRRFRVPK